jgi:hypothetical protein
MGSRPIDVIEFNQFTYSNQQQYPVDFTQPLIEISIEMVEKLFCGAELCRCLRLTISPPFVGRLSGQCGSSTSHKHKYLHTCIALLYIKGLEFRTVGRLTRSQSCTDCSTAAFIHRNIKSWIYPVPYVKKDKFYDPYNISENSNRRKYHQGLGGDMYLRNVGSYISHTTSCLRRRHPS